MTRDEAIRLAEAVWEFSLTGLPKDRIYAIVDRFLAEQHPDTGKRPQSKSGGRHTCDGTGIPECLACDAIDEREDALHPIVNPIDGTRWRVAPAEQQPDTGACDADAEMYRRGWQTGHARGVAEERERCVHLLAKQREKYSRGTRLQLAMTTAIGTICATPIRAAQEGES